MCLLSIVPNLSDGVFITLLVLAVVVIAALVFVALKILKKKNEPSVQIEEGSQLEEPTLSEKSFEEPIAAEPVTAVEEAMEESAEEEPNEVNSETVSDSDGEEEDEEIEVEQVERFDTKSQRLIIIKYKKSFLAKLIQSPEKVKTYYSHLKNELLSYKGVKSRISWKYESFYAGRVQLAKLSIRGKSLKLFLALNPKEYAESKYIIDDMSEVITYEHTPLLYRIKNDRRLHYSAELIERLMQGRERLTFELIDYVSMYPYEETEPLLKRGLIKELTDREAQSGNVFKLKESVHVAEVNHLIEDEVAASMIETSAELSDKSKTEIVNIDLLSKYFADGDTVTIAEMKERIPHFSQKATAVKVLARGTLNKKLKVIADSFSLEAVKMIVLTGGSAVKKQGK